MKTTFIFTIFMLSLILGCVKPKDVKPLNEKDAGCPTPTNVTKTGATTSSISYSWDNMGSSVSYKVRYVRTADSYNSPYYYTLSPSYTFSSLASGNYSFYFYTVCTDPEGTSDAYINWDDVEIR